MFKTKSSIALRTEDWREGVESPEISKVPPPPATENREDVLPEDLFRRLLCWERKKAERTERSFLLMLVNIEGALRASQGGQQIISGMVSALYSSKRETDIAGWYREGTVLGVIFAEIDNADRTAPERFVHTRVSGAIRDRLGALVVDQIHISFHVFPEDWRQVRPGRALDAELYPDLFEREEARRFSHFLKRSVDIVGSIVGLLLGSPLLIAIPVAIKLTSKGPILFKQERVGQHGRPFTLLKFRSMKCANDPSIHREYVKRFIAGKADSAQPGGSQKTVYKIQDDPRVTRVGRFLRRTSLDELPQFINVLKGEMSLVGPRPALPYELEAYHVWHRCRVLEAMPGITGPWQVNGRSRLRFDEMVRLDLQYARTWSLWTDIKILLQTPRAAFFCEGAY